MEGLRGPGARRGFAMIARSRPAVWRGKPYVPAGGEPTGQYGLRRVAGLLFVDPRLRLRGVLPE